MRPGNSAGFTAVLLLIIARGAFAQCQVGEVPPSVWIQVTGALERPDGSSYYAPDTPIQFAAWFSYASCPMTFHWRFSDGVEADGATVTRSFPRPGSYLASVLGLGDAGSYSQVTELLVAFPQDAIVVTGVGSPGDWQTEIRIPPTDDTIQLSEASQFQPGRPIAGQPWWEVFDYTDLIVIAPGTLTRMRHPDEPISTFYVVAPRDHPLPVVRVRVVKSEQLCQTIQLPVVRLARLEEIDPVEFVFSGVARTPISHTNLVMASVRPLDGGARSDDTITVAVLDENGQPLASADYTVPFGRTLFIGDVIGSVGVPYESRANLRVTRTSGDGLLWGIATTVAEDGSITASTGINP